MDKTSYKPVQSFSGLAQFGIAGLTGEACAYSMRMLCDVSEEGKALLEDFFGTTLVLTHCYNSMVGDKPSIGSIMLVHQMVLKLAQFAFFRAGALAVVANDREVNGIFDESRLAEYERHIEQYPNCGMSLCRNYALKSSAPRVGSRMVHAATGRVQ